MAIVSVLPIMAEEKYSLEDFNKTIENSNYYEEYKNSIIERDVFVEADTDGGKRFIDYLEEIKLKERKKEI